MLDVLFTVSVLSLDPIVLLRRFGFGSRGKVTDHSGYKLSYGMYGTCSKSKDFVANLRIHKSW